MHIPNSRLLIESVSDCCLTPARHFFRYIMARTSYIFDGVLMMMTALYYINTLSWNV